jgi:hypothetical protein
MLKLLRLSALCCVLCALCIGLAFSFGTAGAQEADLCAGLPEARLADGALAKITSPSDPRFPGGYLKPRPARAGPVLRYLPVGTVLRIYDKPTCTAEGERWWQTQIDTLRGWMIETSGPEYFMEPFTGEPPAPLPTTIQPVLTCIRPIAPDPNATPGAGGGTPGVPLLRVAYGAADGGVGYTDNAGAVRVVAQFDPPPTSVDLSPDGSAAVVVNLNGLYWLDILTGRFIMVADAATFQLEENMTMRRAWWLPDGASVAVEVEDINNDITSYLVWTLPINGVGQPFNVTIGIQPRDSVRRTPDRRQVLLLSANDIGHYPRSYVDETPPLLEFVPRFDESDARALLPPAITWTPDGKGFYTYIPTSSEAPPDDPIQGRVWQVPFQGQPIPIGRPENVAQEDYVIPSPDGKYVLLGSGSKWRVQDSTLGEIVRELPPVRFLFDWTPDGKGVVYTGTDGKSAYLGLDGETASPYVPAADNLFNITWLPDGTTAYVAQGADGKFSLSIKPPAKDPVFVGLASTIYSYSAALLPASPGLPRAPEPCAQ